MGTVEGVVEMNIAYTFFFTLVTRFLQHKGCTFGEEGFTGQVWNFLANLPPGKFSCPPQLSVNSSPPQISCQTSFLTNSCWPSRIENWSKVGRGFTRSRELARVQSWLISPTYVHSLPDLSKWSGPPRGWKADKACEFSGSQSHRSTPASPAPSMIKFSNFMSS